MIKTRNHLNRIPEHTFVGEGGGGGGWGGGGGENNSLKFDRKKHATLYFPQDHCKCSTNFCQMLFLALIPETRISN